VTVNGVAVDGSSTHSLPESAAAAVVTPGSSLIPAAHSSAVAVAERDAWPQRSQPSRRGRY